MVFSLKNFMHRRFRILTGVAGFFYAISNLPVDHFIFDLLDHLQGYYFLWFMLSLFLSVYYFSDKYLAWCSAFFLVASPLTNFIPLSSFIGFSSGKSEQASVKIVSANVLFSNNRYHDIEKMIRQEDPDILSIIELSDNHQQELGGFLENRYHYQFVRPENYPTGIGLYSKFPLTNVGFFEPALDGFVFISASAKIHEKNYNLLAIHPCPPIFQIGFKNRNAMYNDLPYQLAQKPGKTIVIGDFNNTIWSDDFYKLMQSLNVKVNPLTPATWPALPFFPKIGIDHILIPQDAHFISIRRGADIGSDHYPLVAEIAL